MFWRKTLTKIIVCLLLGACSTSTPPETTISHEDTREFSGVKDDTSSTFFVSDERIEITSKGGTDQWEEVDTSRQWAYRASGNFIAEVKLIFTPDTQIQHAGIGIKSIQDPFTWIRITRTIHPFIEGFHGLYVMADDSGTSVRLNRAIYTRSTTFLKIERNGEFVTLSFSPDNKTWTILQSTYRLAFSDEVDVFLLVYSTNSDEEATANFENFRITTLP